jgi:hypothetical protein
MTMTAEQQLDAAIRAGDKAFQDFGPNISRDQLREEACRRYSSKEERATFFLGYCFTEMLLTCQTPEQRGTASARDGDLATSFFGRDAEWKAAGAYNSFLLKGEDAFQAGEKAAVTFGPALPGLFSKKRQPLRTLPFLNKVRSTLVISRRRRSEIPRPVLHQMPAKSETMLIPPILSFCVNHSNLVDIRF